MKTLIKYIYIVIFLFTSCQVQEFSEELSSVQEQSIEQREVAIPVSVTIPVERMSTKVMGQSPDEDIQNLYLLVFDENGYFIESRLAEKKAFKEHEGHPNERNYIVKLTLTDKKRIIHFIANCPIDQIGYGHENEVISNMTVKKGDPNETAYWYRVVVPYINTGEDGENLDEDIAELLTCVPLLRNFSQVTVVSDIDEKVFKLESFAVYNTINEGTVAPYNKSIQEFQMFHDNEGLYTYDELLGNGFHGHAKAGLKLDNELSNADFINPGDPFYMYERKISVRTDEEDKWDESPTHIIIKGKYGIGDGNENEVSSTYYKVDLIREVDGDHQYFNLLRNFKYIFTLKSVQGAGYNELDDAMDNPAGNNLSGATDTQGFTNISDGLGRVFVSFTDTTLVSTHTITLKYKYIPNINDPDLTTANGRVQVRFLGEGQGNVIKGYTIATADTEDGWRTIAFEIQDIDAIKKQEEIKLHVSDNPNLHKTIRFTLHRPFSMTVTCDPKKISEGIAEEMNVKVGIPDDLTDNLFPMDFRIEVDKLSLGPNTQKGTILPVESGPSIIPSKEGNPSFYYIYTLDKELYDDLAVVGGQKIIDTDWLTNTKESAARVYVSNKYFNSDNDNFLNVDNAFTNLSITPSPIFNGVGQTASISFTGDDKDTMFTSRTITVKLQGLENSEGQSEFTIKPSGNTVTINNLITNTVDGKISFRIEEDSYIDATSTEINRQQGKFSNLTITPANIFYGVGQTASISFSMDAADALYASRQVTVKLNGLENSEGKTVFIVQPTEGNRTVTINNLSTTSISFPVSFTVEESSYATATSAEAIRERFEFENTQFSRNPIPRGIGQTVNITFSKDSRDNNFNSRELTVVLDGLETADGGSEIVILNPSSSTITIENLRTITDRADVSFTVKTNGSDYSPATTKATRPKGRFENLTLSELPSDKDQPVVFSFDISEEDYYDGMVVLVTTEGLESDDSRLEAVATRASHQSKYTPSTYGPQTLYLKTEQDGSGNRCSVSIVDEEGYFEEESISATQKPNTITIPAGNLVTYFSNNTNFNDDNSQYRTIYLYSVNPQNNNNATPIAQYTYKRDRTNTGNPAQYREAHNPEQVVLPAGTSTVYIKYQHSNRATYYKSFDAATASTNVVRIRMN